MFYMPKYLGLAIGFVSFMLFWIFELNQLPFCGGVCLVGVIIGVMSIRRIIRDQNLAEAGKAAQRLVPPALPTPRMTSKGTGRLFVPPPLKKE
jgi:hypothetical protein